MTLCAECWDSILRLRRRKQRSQSPLPTIEGQRKEWEKVSVFDDETTGPQPIVPEATPPEERGEEEPVQKTERTGSTEIFF